MENTLTIVIRGSKKVLNNIQISVNNQIQSKSKVSLFSSQRVAKHELHLLFNIDHILPIIAPVYHGCIGLNGKRDIEISATLESEQQEIDHDLLKEYIGFTYRLLKDNPDYINESILLNNDSILFDNDKKLYLVFNSDSIYGPQFFILNKYAGETFKDLLSGFERS